ncbi:MAG: crotonase [Candidatus Binatia bacterium]|nr:MAG: crotonase [Candidatus Binatia bacterium]
MAEFPRVRVDRRADGVRLLVLDDPERRNAMTARLLSDFSAAVAGLASDPEARVLVVTGAGKHFCSGADFRDPPASDPELPPGLRFHASARATYGAFLGLLDLEIPTIAAVNGAAIGGGLGLALLCDLRVVAEDARLGATFATLGFHPGMAITYLLPRLVGLPRAAEILFTGRVLGGREALELGLANRCVPAAELLDAALGLAGEIAEKAPLAIRLMKRALYRALDFDPREAAEYEALAQALTLESEDAGEGIRALLEKRKPVFRGR